MFKTSSVDFLQVNAGHLPQVERFLAQGGGAIGNYQASASISSDMEPKIRVIIGPF